MLTTSERKLEDLRAAVSRLLTAQITSSDPILATLAAQALESNCAVVPRGRLEELSQALWAHPTMEDQR